MEIICVKSVEQIMTMKEKCLDLNMIVFFLFTLYLHCMLHYYVVILHALLLHISTVLYLFYL